jgi:hypothetical protein
VSKLSTAEFLYFLTFARSSVIPITAQPWPSPLPYLVVQPLKTKRAAIRQINEKGIYGYHESHRRYI